MKRNYFHKGLAITDATMPVLENRPSIRLLFVPMIRPLQGMPDSTDDLPQGDGFGQDEKRMGRASLLD